MFQFTGFPPSDCRRASPKAISRRTSYLRVRLEFLRYPHLIRYHFNGSRFGPPWSFTSTSTWTWVGHPVSGLLTMTILAPYSDLVSLRLRTSWYLTLPQLVTRRTVLQKVRGCASYGASTACKHRVSGSLSLPSRGSFHLSFTVLCAIGHRGVFRLGGWSPRLPTRFLVSRGTLDTARLHLDFAYGIITLFDETFQTLQLSAFLP